MYTDVLNRIWSWKNKTELVIEEFKD